MLSPSRYWKLWLAAPAVLLWMQSAQASETRQNSEIQTTSIASQVKDFTSEVSEPPLKIKSDVKETTPNFDQVNNVAALESTEAPPGMEQVTSVSQFSDVRPTDWAFQALQSLVERYGCIAGYPDRTYRGNRALTRFEFAAGLNACLDRINELIAAATSDLVKKEDLATLQKLQEQFATELATIRGRVDALEARTTTLERQQFSTTTKLSGNAYFNITNASAGRDVLFEGVPGSAADARFAGARTAAGTPIASVAPDPQTTLSFLTWLTLNTSFTGRDSLVTQLAAGNGISPYNQYASAGFFNASGVPFLDQTAGTVNGQSDIVIRDFFYSFPLGEAIKVTVGPRINWYRHFDGNRFLNIFASGASFDTSNSTQSNTIDRGSGAVVEVQLSRQFRLALGYLGESTEFLPAQFGFNTSSNPRFGLFGGTNTASAELTFSPSDNFNLRLQYNYSRIQAYGGQVGGAIGEPIPYGYLDAGVPGASVLDPVTGAVSSGGLRYAYANMFGVNFDWLITPGIGLFGRYSFANTRLNPVNGRVDTQSFQVGAAFPDLGKKGAQATIAFVMPMDITRGRRFFASGGGDGGTQYELEASYFFPISDKIAIVPTFYAIFNPNNFDANPTVYVGNIRTQFSF
ncbi:hypothetical protein LEP3755_21140 [Leptolyngbya sp. NIES-3755]|nr:hypothetical protein LEP3755_21140 [Leptolyngbya sp. NIES-3755]